MIFYFSATGNSQHVAERIAGELGEKLISMGVAMRDGHFDYDVSKDKYVGFVCPTFAYTLPGIVAEFIEKLNLTGLDGQYVFGAFTCGAASGGECAALGMALAAKGIGYNGSFDIVMPDNYIVWSNVPSEAVLTRRLAAADQVIDGIIEAIKAGKNGHTDGKAPEMPFLPYGEIDSDRGVGNLYADDNCTGCGQCAEMCPMGAISVVDGRAKFKGQCCVCFTCLHRCPSHAVQHGRDTQNKGRYVHPEAKFRTRNDY